MSTAYRQQNMAALTRMHVELGHSATLRCDHATRFVRSLLLWNSMRSTLTREWNYSARGRALLTLAWHDLARSSTRLAVDT